MHIDFIKNIHNSLDTGAIEIIEGERDPEDAGSWVPNV